MLKPVCKILPNGKKIAVVSAEKGVEWFTDVFTLATPGKSKGFKPEEIEEAKAWLNAED